MTFNANDLESPKTFTAGVKAKHVIVSTACRKMRGDHNAAHVAAKRIEDELLVLLANWPQEKNATFHLILTVDSKGRGDPYAPTV